ncbi:amino acid ABC transporter permease [Brevibacterium moorei]|uniref:amino acid ABC transporter permease n=2 Tax=Brevibacterium TaxID=1696 RepID=UPI00211CD0D4|nr:amino acid ABC transporter permease [Brevibacterium sp. 68QC2CO]MCQ9386614.1 amino acid ABC transporter permease [Brevibacterium sp. 68QC2CO]
MSTVTSEAPTDWKIRYHHKFNPRKVITGAIGVVLVLFVIYLFATGNLQWSKTLAYLFDYRILTGVGYTLIYSVLAMVLGVIGGGLLAVGMLSDNPVWKNLSKAYVALFRALPLLILLLIFYNIAIFIPHLGIGPASIDVNKVVTPFAAAVLGLALHEAAYMAEIVRSGINGVARGQAQAAESMGMTRGQAMRWVIMPQAIRLIVPPTANQFISMLKNTSLVVVIAGNDLLTVTKELYSNNFLTMELLFVAAIWYLVLVLIFSWLSGLLERRYSRGA